MKDWTRTDVRADWEAERWNGSPAHICWPSHSTHTVRVRQAEPMRLARTTWCKWLSTMVQCPGNAKQNPTGNGRGGSSVLLRHHFTTWGQCRAATAWPALATGAPGLCRRTMQEEVRTGTEQLLSPGTPHTSSSAAWKDLACYNLSEAPWQPTMREMCAIFQWW